MIITHAAGNTGASRSSSEMKPIQKRWRLAITGLILAAALTACPHNRDDSDEPDEPPQPPVIKSLTLVQVPKENGFTASWEPETEHEGLSYEVFHNESGTAPSAEASGLPVEEPQAQVTSGLAGGKTYTVWVRSVLETEKGPWSTGETITLKQDQTAMTFSIEVFGQTRFAVIQGDAARIQVPRNTPLPWRFTPLIALAEGASLVSSPGMDEEADFSDPEQPVHYLVKAENEREQDYTVTLSTGDESGLELIREPEEELLTLTSPIVLSRAKNQSRILIIQDPGIQDFTWYADGMLKSRTNAVRLTAADYKPGVHYLTVNGYKTYGEGDQVPWSTEHVFTVTE
jgi:hypothetical protein